MTESTKSIRMTRRQRKNDSDNLFELTII